MGSLPRMTDEPLDVEAQRGTGEPAARENKGSPDQPWEPGEQRYSDRPEQGGETPGPAKVEPTD